MWLELVVIVVMVVVMAVAMAVRWQPVVGGGDESVSPPTIYTVGHSTQSMNAFIDELKSHGIKVLVDVRSLPGSNKFPQFDSESMSRVLRSAGVKYIWMKELGGLRRPDKSDTNNGWRNRSFRGFADYMQTPEFASALVRLEDVARASPTAIMCAEVLPWRCHRSLIGDALVTRGWNVMDIFSAGVVKPHRVTGFMRIVKTAVTYPLVKPH